MRKEGQLLVTLAALFAAGSLRAQIKTELVNWQGATAPCVGIGPVGGPLAKKCANFFEQAGFIRTGDLGATGITVGENNNNTVVVTAVAPGSVAQSAGIAAGDLLASFNGTRIENHPGAEAERMLFGHNNQTIQVHYDHDGQPHDVTLTLAHVAVKNPPKLGAFMMVVKPLVNWRGDYVPCSGAGPAYMAAIAFCEKHFSDFGFVKPDDAASAGITFDEGNTQAAIVKNVDPASSAAKAGILPGDTILAVDGKPVPGGAASQAQQALFAKIGTKIAVGYTHEGQPKSADLTLVQAPH